MLAVAKGQAPLIIQPPSTLRALPDSRRVLPPTAQVRLPIQGES